MKIKLLFILIGLFSLSNIEKIQAQIYVKEGGTGDGSSWSNALGDLQEAINQAHSKNQVWVAKGTYKPTRKADDIYTVTPNNRDNAFVVRMYDKVYGGFSGDETELSQRDPKKNITILSGDLGIPNNNSDNAYHVIIFPGIFWDYCILDGFTITGGNANGSGNLYTKQSTMNDSYIISRSNGGGIYCSFSGPDLTNLIITNNQAANYGGGVYLNIGSSPRFLHTSIDSNWAAQGGGIFNDRSATNLCNSFVINNQATGYGGGIHNKEPDALNYDNTVIANNKANIAGGIYLEAEKRIDVFFFTNLTITGNSATRGGGLHIAYGANPLITNSIIWGNGPANKNVDNYISEPEYFSSLVEGVTTKDTNDNLPGNINPLFVNSQKLDFRLQPESTAIDAGNNEFVRPYYSEIDLAGNSRIIGEIVDLGAYEYPAPTINNLYVKKGENGDGSSWSNALGELSDALSKALKEKPNSLKQIWVAKGTYTPKYVAGNGTNPINDRSFVLPKNTKIYGGFTGTETSLDQRNWKDNPTVLSGDINGNDGANFTNISDNAYHVVIAVGDLGSTVLDGFTIKGGNASLPGNYYYIVNDRWIYTGYGGGVYVSGSKLKLNNLIISDNRAAQGGGGIIIDTSSPVLTQVIVSNNKVNDNNSIGGGGIYNFQSSSTFSYVTINNNKIESNNAQIYGGGIYNYQSPASKFTNLVISGNSIILPNQSFNGFGGGIFNKQSPITIINALIVNNKAKQAGGLFVENSENSELINATISGNQATSASGLFNHSMSIKLYNSIMWGNNPVNETVTNYNGTPFYSYSLVQGVTNTDMDYNISGATDPLFVNMTGGNYRLQSTSPVINKGNNLYWKKGPLLWEPISTDLDNNPRIFEKNIGGKVDLGTYEYQGSINLVATAKENLVTSNENKKEDIYVYPNPVSVGQQVLIKINMENKGSSLQLYDLIGNQVKSTLIQSGEINMTMPTKAGVYVLKVMNETGTVITKRIIVQ